MSDEAREAEVGIRCPRCGCSHFWVTHTQRTRGGRIRRRRECRHCGRPMITFERPIGPDQGPIGPEPSQP